MVTLAGFLLALVGCTSEQQRDGVVRNIRGTMVRVEVEGGFYGIVAENGNKYDPLNLPDAFKVDGIKVKCQIEELDQQVSIHMWGKLVRILEIEKATDDQM